MKKYLILFLVVLFTVCVSGVAFASTNILRANPVFISAGVSLNSNMCADFIASTKQDCSSIKVTSVVLEKKSGNTWGMDKTLTPPDKVVNNGSDYTASVDYSGKAGTGTYRLKAVFNADGETITRYSNERTF